MDLDKSIVQKKTKEKLKADIEKMLEYFKKKATGNKHSLTTLEPNNSKSSTNLLGRYYSNNSLDISRVNYHKLDRIDISKLSSSIMFGNKYKNFSYL